MVNIISNEQKNDVIEFAKEIATWTLEEKQTAIAIITGMNLQKKLDVQFSQKN